MKKFMFVMAVSMFMMGCLLINTAPGFGSVKPDKTVSAASIPDSISSLIDKSCMTCHSSPGNPMAMDDLDFDKWDSYNAEKQAREASAMCRNVSRGTMPPKIFRNNNPDRLPSQKEIDALCAWSKAITITK